MQHILNPFGCLEIRRNGENRKWVLIILLQCLVLSDSSDCSMFLLFLYLFCSPCSPNLKCLDLIVLGNQVSCSVNCIYLKLSGPLMPIQPNFIGLHTRINKQPINVLWCFLQTKFYLRLWVHVSWQKMK